MSRKADRTDPLVRDVARCIDAHDLLGPNGHVLVAVSGGADSVALLAVLRELARQPGRAYRLTVAHLDHGLRPDSAGDAAWVADLARRWGLACIHERRDAAEAARRQGLSVEEAARGLRYAFLAEAAAAAGADRIALGHHADDNVETILQRIVRGTHLRGLAGMPIQRPAGGDEGGLACIVRPMLRCRRSQIEAYCRRRRLAWRTDATNADTAYRRNFIRHELLPLLRRRLNPQADEAVLRLAAAAEEAEAFLADQAHRALAAVARQIRLGRAVLAAGGLAQLAPLLRRHVLRRVLERLGVPMQAVDHSRLCDLADLAADRPPAAVDLPGPYRARREGADLVIETPGQEGTWTDALRLKRSGWTPLPDGRRIGCRTLRMDRRRFAAHVADHRPGVEWLDADKLRGRLTCRLRRRGDAFVPLGAPGRQTVSDFLTNLKLPRRRRAGIVCILDARGLVCLAGLRIADRVKVTPATRRVLSVEIGEQPRHESRPLEEVGG